MAHAPDSPKNRPGAAGTPSSPTVDAVDPLALTGRPRPVDPGNDFERIEPYLPDFAEAALLEDEDVALLAAICLRETWAGWAPGYAPKGSYLGRGDHGHGRMLFQFDDRGPWSHLPRECPEATPFLQARWACHVLDCNRKNLSDFAGHPLYERAVVAAYNAFSFPVAAYAARRDRDPVRKALVLGHDPDHVTTPGGYHRPRRGDYGAHVLAIRDRLRAQHPDRFPPDMPGVA
jgi:hypothetical protein